MTYYCLQTRGLRVKVVIFIARIAIQLFQWNLTKTEIRILDFI